MVDINRLWSSVVGLIYDRHGYVEELKALLASFGVSRRDLIIDACCGSGFPSIDLASDGYMIEPLDGTSAMVSLFDEYAREAGIPLRAKLLRWGDLPAGYAGSAGALLCRGNSLIYAGGSWGEDDINPGRAYEAIRCALKNFFECLESGGTLYVDKFDRNEVPGEYMKGVFMDEGVKEALIWRVEHDVERKMRRWSLIREQADGKRIEYPCKGYFLMHEELRYLLMGAGFVEVEEKSVRSEKNYSVLLARKPSSLRMTSSRHDKTRIPFR